MATRGASLIEHILMNKNVFKWYQNHSEHIFQERGVHQGTMSKEKNQTWKTSMGFLMKK